MLLYVYHWLKFTRDAFVWEAVDGFAGRRQQRCQTFVVEMIGGSLHQSVHNKATN